MNCSAQFTMFSYNNAPVPKKLKQFFSILYFILSFFYSCNILK